MINSISITHDNKIHYAKYYFYRNAPPRIV